MAAVAEPNSVRPQQFGVIDLFALMTLAALASAMLAPFVRAMQTENQLRLLLGAILQFGTAAIATVWAITRRRKLLEQSGPRIGIGYCGQIRWPLWPVVKSMVYMLLLAMVQIGLALVAVAVATEHPFLLFYQLLVV
jgi:hypothetical protein